MGAETRSRGFQTAVLKVGGLETASPWACLPSLFRFLQFRWFWGGGGDHQLLPNFQFVCVLDLVRREQLLGFDLELLRDRDRGVALCDDVSLFVFRLRSVLSRWLNG